MTDPYVGQLTFVRVYWRAAIRRHRVQPDQGQEGTYRPYPQMHANQREEIKEILAGDIAACVGLKEVTTVKPCAIPMP